jgi:very-short-patch-repair endonuclease
VIEIDGEVHINRRQKDRHRTGILNMLGLRVIRFTNREVLENLDSVLRKISHACIAPPPLATFRSCRQGRGSGGEV